MIKSMIVAGLLALSSISFAAIPAMVTPIVGTVDGKDHPMLRNNLHVVVVCTVFQPETEAGMVKLTLPPRRPSPLPSFIKNDFSNLSYICKQR